jgi:hypothetical protein
VNRRPAALRQGPCIAVWCMRRLASVPKTSCPSLSLRARGRHRPCALSAGPPTESAG